MLQQKIYTISAIWAYPNPVCNQLGLELHPGLLSSQDVRRCCSKPRTPELFIWLSWEKLQLVHLQSKYIHPLYLLLQLHPGVWRPRSGHLSGVSQTSYLAAAALLGNSQGGHTLEHNIHDHLLGRGTAVCSCPSPSSASRHAQWWCLAETMLPPYWKAFSFWSQKSTKLCLSVFPFPKYPQRTIFHQILKSPFLWTSILSPVSSWREVCKAHTSS